MRIEGLCACVDYADMLAITLPRWAATLDRLVVVTSPTDDDTIRLCAAADKVDTHITDVFYAHGAAFNKGAAMEEGRRKLNWTDWVLFFDADILPPADWGEQVAAANPKPGLLYGAYRFECDDSAVPLDDGGFAGCEWPGYFQLFHTSDPNVQDDPLLDTTWLHAGGYDSEFQRRWDGDTESPQKIRLPIRLLHLGQPGESWCGRHDQGRRMLEQIFATRLRQPLDQRCDHEHISPD